MANFSAKIFNSSLSGLRAQLAKISVISNNIANAETPGYSRRVVSLSTSRSPGSTILNQVGEGVEIERIFRITDQFLFNNLLKEGSSLGFFSIQMDLVSRLDSLYGSTGVGGQLSTRLTEFFQSASELSLNPGSTALRRGFIEKGQLLTDSINLIYRTLATLQMDAQRVLNEKVKQVNQLTNQISELNTQIKQFEAQNGLNSALDLRDQRDQAIEELSKLLSFDLIENPDGSVMISLKNGFTLVNGGFKVDLRNTSTPSFTSNITYALDGSQLTYIVGELGPNSHVDLSEVIKNSGGEIGGLLHFRGTASPSVSNPFSVTGTIVGVARQVEALARYLITTVNQVYRGWDPTLPFNGDEDPGSPGYFDASSVDLLGNAPGVYGLFGLSGVTLTDSNLDGLPNDLGTLTVFSVAERLKWLVDSPDELALSRDLDPTPGSLLGSSGDGRIAQAIANLRYQDFNFTAPNFTFNGKIMDLVHLTETHVGHIVRNVQSNFSAYDARHSFYAQKLNEIRGVNLDEEMALLIQFQKNYQYSARLLGVADTILDEILRIL